MNENSAIFFPIIPSRTLSSHHNFLIFRRASDCDPYIPNCRLGSAFCFAKKLGNIQYLLNVPLTEEDTVISQPPKSWMQLCVENNLCDKEGDTLNCLHTAVSKGFKYKELKTLVQLFVDKFFFANENELFMAEIPVGAETNEEVAEVTDTLLGDISTDKGTLLPHTNAKLQRQIHTLPMCAYEWSLKKLKAVKDFLQQLLVLQKQVSHLSLMSL